MSKCVVVPHWSGTQWMQRNDTNSKTSLSAVDWNISLTNQLIAVYSLFTDTQVPRQVQVSKAPWLCGSLTILLVSLCVLICF